MSRWIKALALFSAAGMAAAALFYHRCSAGWLLTLAITLGTTAFHLLLRLAAGGVIPLLMRGPAPFERRWFWPLPFEQCLFRVLRVKKWKGRLPSYRPELFSPACHTLEEIAAETCRAELIHAVCAMLSFLPLLFCLRFGSFAVFFFTSAAAAVLDMLCVLLQRYNRPRILRLLKKMEQKKAAIPQGTDPTGELLNC